MVLPWSRSHHALNIHCVEWYGTDPSEKILSALRMPRRVNGRQSGIVDKYGSHHRCYGRVHTKKDGNSVVSYRCNMVRFKSDANVLVRNSSRFNQDDLIVCGGKMQWEFSQSGEMIREVTKVCHDVCARTCNNIAGGDRPYFIDGVWICPYIADYPRGNSYEGGPISHDGAIKKEEMKRRGKCKQITSLLYNEKMDGFKPQLWTNHIRMDGDIRLRLMPSGHAEDDDDGDGEGHILSIHRSHNIKENEELFEMASHLYDTHPPVRNGKQWEGVGGMIGIGDHLAIFPHKHLTNFVIDKEFRNQESITMEKKILSECGTIFCNHFIDRNVGFEEMMSRQMMLWPHDPSKSYEYWCPRCWNASENLGNEMHRDKDGDRSFAVWVNSKGDASTSWYLLFPEWEVAIEMTNGTWISWDGRFCGHCSAVPVVAQGDRLLSLFCSLPKNLCNHLEAKASKSRKGKKNKEKTKVSMKGKKTKGKTRLTRKASASKLK